MLQSCAQLCLDILVLMHSYVESHRKENKLAIQKEKLLEKQFSQRYQYWISAG